MMASFGIWLSGFGLGIVATCLYWWQCRQAERRRELAAWNRLARNERERVETLKS